LIGIFRKTYRHQAWRARFRHGTRKFTGINRCYSEEIGNAKSENDESWFDRGHPDCGGDIYRERDDDDRVATNNGKSGNGEKDRPAVHTMSYRAACAE
jgi:hypothetical protein